MERCSIFEKCSAEQMCFVHVDVGNDKNKYLKKKWETNLVTECFVEGSKACHVNYFTLYMSLISKLCAGLE